MKHLIPSSQIWNNNEVLKVNNKVNEKYIIILNKNLSLYENKWYKGQKKIKKNFNNEKIDMY